LCDFTTAGNRWRYIDGIVFDAVNTTGNAVWIHGNEQIFDDCEFKNSNAGNGTPEGSYMMIYADGTGAGSHNSTFKNCWIHAVGSGSGAPNKYNYAMYPSGSGVSNGWVIDNCLFEDIGATAISAWPNVGGIRITNNIVRNFGTNSEPYGQGNRTAIFVAAGDDNRIYNNIADGQVNGEYGINAGYSATNTLIYHNTVYECSVTAITLGTQTGTIIRNNIMWQNADTIQGSGYTASNNLTTDPGFVNAAGGDFHLNASDNGGFDLDAVVPTDKDGVARHATTPDRGAYEKS
jgi:hypothetical protein